MLTQTYLKIFQLAGSDLLWDYKISPKVYEEFDLSIYFCYHYTLLFQHINCILSWRRERDSILFLLQKCAIRACSSAGFTTQSELLCKIHNVLKLMIYTSNVCNNLANNGLSANYNDFLPVCSESLHTCLYKSKDNYRDIRTSIAIYYLILADKFDNVGHIPVVS